MGRSAASGLAHSGPHGPATLSPQDWERVYGHPIWFAETFIDPERFRGTCYRAANWVLLGRTTGRGKDDQTASAEPFDQGSASDLPLTRRFRELLFHIGYDASGPASDELEDRLWRNCAVGSWTEPGKSRSGEADYLKLEGRTDVLDERLKRHSDDRENPNRGGVPQACRQRRHAGVGVTPSLLQVRGMDATAPRHIHGSAKGRHPRGKLASWRCLPGVRTSRVYTQRQPKTLVRVVGQAPVEATVFEMERLRCNTCGQVFTAEEPEGIGPDKYDATATAMIAQLKYGTGVPFTRLERDGKTNGDSVGGGHAVGDWWNKQPRRCQASLSTN